MKYLNKRFNVYFYKQNEPKCYACGSELKVGYCTKGGMLCATCYNQKRQEKIEMAEKKLG